MYLLQCLSPEYGSDARTLSIYYGSSFRRPAMRLNPMDVDQGALLVVDDNEMNRDMLSRRLQRKGYAVTVAADGRQALNLIGTTPFDLVLLDIMMPDINGLEVLQQVRQAHAATALPIIMVTAKDQSEDIVQALKFGASDYVTKPLDFPVVHARIETQLALKRAVDQIYRLEKNLARRNEELEAANADLAEANKRMRLDLEAAAKVQKALLPAASREVLRPEIAWAFRPCDKLAGDLLNVVQLDDNHVGLYVLDVVGHGVASALLSVMVSRLMAPNPSASSLLCQRGDGVDKPRLVPPVEVAVQLSNVFPWDPVTQQFFTLLYGILTLDTQEFRFVSAGHPGPVHLCRGEKATPMQVSGFPIGLGETSFGEYVVNLKVGDRLYLYSDGLTDVMNERREHFGMDNLLRSIEVHRTLGIHENVTALMHDVEVWCGQAPPHDDISLLAFEIAHISSP
jgi:sigma-B regulation protein RsbU (phosphoserine phosphatase)